MDEIEHVREGVGVVMTTQLLAVDISRLTFSASNSPEAKTLRWDRNGRRVGSVNCTTTCSSIRLDYAQDDGRRVSSKIQLTQTYPYFGGARRWFICPDCQRRCRVLYYRSSFKCRACARAVYPSQYDYIRVAGEAKAKRARSLVGTKADFGIVAATKPRGMHWKTYRKLEQLIWDADVAFDEFIASKI